MQCYINSDIINCLYIIDDISKFYVAEFKSVDVNYDSGQEKIIDIFTDINWQQILFDSISIQTDHSVNSDSYTTTIKLSISELTNEVNLYTAEGKKFLILFVDKNNKCFCDGVLSNDNGYSLQNIQTEISNDNNIINFEFNKTSNNNIKEIDENYFNFNNI